MSRQIFRKEALSRLASPDQLDQLMPLTQPRGWIALAALGLILTTALLWGALGRIDTTVAGEGVLVRPGGVRTVEAPQAGIVDNVAVEIGESVAKGQELLRLSDQKEDNLLPIASPIAGRVVELAVKEGDLVERNTPLATLESLARPPQALLFLPANDGFQVQPGMRVQLFLTTDKDQQTGALAGRVTSAGRHPATPAAMLRALKNEGWATSLSRNGPCLEVTVALIPNRRGSEDARPELYSGTPCRASITVGRRRPIQLIFPVSVLPAGF